MLTENDSLLSLSLSSKGGEGTGNARHLQAREGLGQHAHQSAHLIGGQDGTEERRRLLAGEVSRLQPFYL